MSGPADQVDGPKFSGVEAPRGERGRAAFHSAWAPVFPAGGASVDAVVSKVARSVERPSTGPSLPPIADDPAVKQLLAEGWRIKRTGPDGSTSALLVDPQGNEWLTDSLFSRSFNRAVPQDNAWNRFWDRINPIPEWGGTGRGDDEHGSLLRADQWRTPAHHLGEAGLRVHDNGRFFVPANEYGASVLATANYAAKGADGDGHNGMLKVDELFEVLGVSGELQKPYNEVVSAGGRQQLEAIKQLATYMLFKVVTAAAAPTVTTLRSAEPGSAPVTISTVTSRIQPVQQNTVTGQGGTITQTIKPAPSAGGAAAVPAGGGARPAPLTTQSSPTAAPTQPANPGSIVSIASQSGGVTSETVVSIESVNKRPPAVAQLGAGRPDDSEDNASEPQLVEIDSVLYARIQYFIKQNDFASLEGMIRGAIRQNNVDLLLAIYDEAGAVGKLSRINYIAENAGITDQQRHEMNERRQAFNREDLPNVDIETSGEIPILSRNENPGLISSGKTLTREALLADSFRDIEELPDNLSSAAVKFIRFADSGDFRPLFTEFQAALQAGDIPAAQMLEAAYSVGLGRAFGFQLVEHRQISMTKLEELLEFVGRTRPD